MDFTKYATAHEGDVIALEHRPEGDQPPYCLVFTTTLAPTISELVGAASRHDATCEKVERIRW